MRPLKRTSLILAGMAGLALFGALLLRARKPAAPNLLVVSACSFNRDHLSAYGYPRETTPNLTRFARDAFVFTNYIAHRSWTNFNYELQRLWRDPAEYPRFAAYPEVFEPVAPGERLTVLKPSYVRDFDSAEWSAAEFRKRLDSDPLPAPGAPPFFRLYHFKSAHFPYAGANRGDIPYGKFLTPESERLLARYRAESQAPHPAPERVPLLTFLFDRPGDAGAFGNDALIARWKRHASYSADLELLRGAYDSKLAFADAEIAPLLDEGARERTVAVLVGDHGVELMEHGRLHNGHAPYDELVRLPLVIRIPGVKGRQIIDTQFSEESLVKLLSRIAEGRLNAPNFRSVAAELEEPAILSRDCAGRVISVRYRNQWKYLRAGASSAAELYDLAADPRETRNVAASHPEVTGKLDELLIERQAELDRLLQDRCPETEIPRTRALNASAAGR